MPNAVFVCHPVSSLAHPHPPPALMCRCHSTPSSSAAITIRGSHRNLPQSSSPIRCLCHLLLLSFVAVVSRRRLPFFQFIVLGCRRRRFLSHCRHRFLLAVDIITIYRPPSPCLLLPAPLLISCRASSQPPSPVVGTTIYSGKSVSTGGPYHVFHFINLPLPACPPLP
jgi:hypothetical protein